MSRTSSDSAASGRKPTSRCKMVRHVVYRNQLVLLGGDDAGDVFLQLVVAFRRDEALPAFDGEDDLDVDLRVGVGHARKMPLLTELGSSFALVLQRCRP